MRIPAPVAAGATIGIVAPAAVVDASALERGTDALRALGFDVRLADHVLDRGRFCAGAPEDRARDLEAMFVDPAVGAVMCARGGYGASHVMPLLDADLLAGHPKLLVGYSDVAPLLGFLIDRCGLPALHGPMAATDLARGLTDHAADRLRALLEAPDAAWEEPIGEVVVPGVATGRLVGGNLAALTALLGTPYAVETAGAVLFLEDVAERPYKVERMLTHLRLAGKLAGVAAVVLGSFVQADGTSDPLVGDVFRAFFADAPHPVVAGFPAGHHLAGNLTLALGLPLTVDTGRGVVAAGAA